MDDEVALEKTLNIVSSSQLVTCFLRLGARECKFMVFVLHGSSISVWLFTYLLYICQQKSIY